MKDKMKKTKIICTIGPASEDPKMLKKISFSWYECYAL